jgi:glutamine amidotransferase
LIGIVDYNMGNLASVKNAFQRLGFSAKVESEPDRLKDYERLILPGVGAFGDAMEHLKETGMDSAIQEYADSGKYMLGICLGMQLLFEKSEEFGNHNGLGLISGEVKKFKDIGLKVPHMGWNRLFPKNDNGLFRGLEDPYLYFVHSYHIVTDDKYTIGETEYGYRFSSSVQKDNIFGLQPHPEKSHSNGLRILRNFAELS